MAGSTEERQAIIDELAAALAARQELGARMEPHVADSFVDRIERTLEKRIDERLAHVPQSKPSPVNPLIAIASLVFGVGATAIVATHLGSVGTVLALIVIWAAIVGLNWAYARR
jgi:hypothetical protein